MDNRVVIRRFQPADALAFGSLNRRWLIDHHLLEPADEKQLTDPHTHIFERGGEIFMAVMNGVTVGCCAAIPHGLDVMEVAKLAVDPAAQGRGIGRRLVLTALAFARERGFGRVMLTSNSALSNALALYESLGFTRRPIPPDVPYASVDVYMELELDAPAV
jgi:ribosomal protein S18 acetylase RimI-like enzyme